jgi:glycosyltransferase involved in cell wall biosynthesis
MNIPVLIPAYNPDEVLYKVVHSLIQLDFKDIIIVNDGSKPEYEPIFEKLEKMEQCHVLRHAVNSGKGRALKTGLNYFCLNFPNSRGIVTADADGQHQPQDILKVAKTLKENPDQLVIGVRKLGRKIPFRSLFGNTLTRVVFSLVIGKKISDTQSGLRGLPRSLVPHLLKVTGERYEYEINMLILSKRHSVDIIETPIDTIYLENNVSSHFNPFFDSMKIYFQLLRFAFSSMLASGCDFIVFSIAYSLTSNIMLSLLIGRFLIGSLLNYIINRRLVFHSKSSVLLSLLKYYLALIVMSVLSYLLITLALDHLGFKVMIAKIVVETLLWVFSFGIQREFVFFSETEDSLER